MTTEANTTAIALVGCGYVCDFYLATLAARRELSVAGVHDVRPERARAVAEHWGVPVYASLEDLLADERVTIVVNLTPPAAHAGVTRRALLAGRHVYSEKPLATSLDAARELVALAKARGLHLCSAPCNALGVSLQTLQRAVLDGAIGRPQLVYAELDDGAVPLMPYDMWRSSSGASWPAADEFATGCVLHHAGYQLDWMVGLLGSVQRITVLSGRLGQWSVDDTVAQLGTDFSSALLQFETGTVARLTCSMLAPRDHSIRIVGDRGTLFVADCWDYWSPVELCQVRQVHSAPAAHRLDYLGEGRVLPPVSPARWSGGYEDTHRMDFALGIAELADAVRTGIAPHLSASRALHVLDVTLLMDTAPMGAVVAPSTHVEPPPPKN